MSQMTVQQRQRMQDAKSAMDKAMEKENTKRGVDIFKFTANKSDDNIENARPLRRKPTTKNPKTKRAKTGSSSIGKPESTTVSDQPAQRPALGVLLQPGSSTREVQSQTRRLSSTPTLCHVLTNLQVEDAQASSITPSGQQTHTDKKAKAVDSISHPNSAKTRPRKRRGSITSEDIQVVKRARVEKDQSSNKRVKNSNTKPAATGTSPNAQRKGTAASGTDAGKSKATKAIPNLTSPSTRTRPLITTVKGVKKGETKTDAKPKPARGGSSSNTAFAKAGAGRVNSNDSPEVDTAPAVSSSSSEQPSAMGSSTHGMEVDDARPERQGPSEEDASADGGENNKGVGEQEISTVSAPRESSNILPPSGSSTEDGEQGEAEATRLGAAGMSRIERVTENLPAHQGPSEKIPSETTSGVAERKSQDEAAVSDVEMGEAGLDLRVGPDEDPNGKAVAMFGFAVGAGAAVFQFFA